MRRLLLLLAVMLFCLPLRAEAPIVIALQFEGAIGPAAEDYLSRGLARAEQRRAVLVVLQLDTPGGLDTAMRAMVKAILGSPIPVAVFVAPKGARAASAGTYILYASHVAAMAPATNLGAATPVQIGALPESPKAEPPAKPEKDTGKGERKKDSAPSDTLARKQVHDAAAYVRSLAQLRHRNAEWGEKAVRDAVSLSADEALRLKVIDLVATDMDELLAKLDGRKIETAAGERVLHTRGATVEAFEPDWRVRLIAVITQPSIALILMMIGVYGLFFEFANPGFVLPGVAGAVSLVLALFALQLLPVNYAGLLLILLGIGFMVAEAFLPAFGSLGVGGVVAFVIGSLILMDTDAPGFGIPMSLVVGLSATSALLLALIGNLALRARRRPVVSGREEMIGNRGEVVSWQNGSGWARVRGELWRAQAGERLAAGQRVRVLAVDGLTLRVTSDYPQGD